MTRPACATSIMAGLGALVRSGLVDRGDALRAVGAFDAASWAPGVVESRDGKAVYRPGKIEAPKKSPKIVEAPKAEKKGREKWIPMEGDLF